MLGKQWLNRFSRADIRGSIAERSRDRVRKSKGMETWHFDLVVESLPVMLQIALFLLGYALSNYLFFLNRTVAAVTIGFTAFGLLFFVLIVSAATLSYTCPFQTPLSLVIRFMIRFDDEHRKYLKRCRKWIRRILSWRTLPRPRFGGPYPVGSLGTSGGGNVGNHIQLAMLAHPPGQQLPPLTGVGGDGSILDSECIVRIFEISTDTDVIQANMKFIPEIFWHPGIRTTPLERLYGAVLECFDRSTGRLVVVPKLRNQAYLGAKALLHLIIQRQCFGDGSDNPVLESISARHQVMGSVKYEGDSDLESTLSIIDHTLNKIEPIRWLNFSPTHPHFAWMAHTLLFRAWDFTRKGEPLPEDIREFVGHAFHVYPFPPAPIIADCLLIIDLAFGKKVDIRDLFAVDKTGLFRDILQQLGDIDEELEKYFSVLYKKFAKVFLDTSTTSAEIDFALSAMAVATSFVQEVFLFEQSHDLFHVIMNAPITLAYTQEKKWQAARYLLRGLCGWADNFCYWAGDPQDVLTFLSYHFDLANQDGEYPDEPILHALRTLGYTQDPVTIEALRHFDSTKPTFVSGICYAFQGDKPPSVRYSALYLLPRIGDKWFVGPHPIMEPDQMRRLCTDWASFVDITVKTPRVKKEALAVLFYMINSPHWRPHIPTNTLRLLDWFTSVPDDSEPLKRCLDNPELTDVILGIADPAVVVAWLKILWLKYGELAPGVRGKLETATKETAQTRKSALDVCLSVVDSELKKVEAVLEEDDTSSVDLGSTTDTKVDNLRQARAALLVLKGG